MKVDIVKLLDIEFGDRQREEYGDIAELAHSIKEKGMISPMAIKATPDAELPYLLIAGGRRFMAATKLELEEVPVRIYERDLNELDFREIELYENIHRKDLDWIERVQQERDIHELHVEKYGEKVSTSPNAEGFSLADTGKVLGRTGEHVRQSIIIANTVEKFPELFQKCKTKADASKVVKTLGEEFIKSEIVKRIKDETSDDKKTSISDNFILESFFHGVENIPAESINLVEIDPPYAIKLESAKKGYNYGDSYNEVAIDDYKTFMQNTLAACYKVMAEHSWLIVWFAPEPWFADMYEMIIEAGFETSRMCGIWTKPSGQNKRPEMNLANSYEMFFYAHKGRPALAKARGNVFDYPPVPAQKKIHPTERPIELMKEIYSTFTFPGSNILIPFLGSGNGIIAANEIDMSAIGFELSREFRDSFLVRVHSK